MSSLMREQSQRIIAGLANREVTVGWATPLSGPDCLDDQVDVRTGGSECDPAAASRRCPGAVTSSPVSSERPDGRWRRGVPREPTPVVGLECQPVVARDARGDGRPTVTSALAGAYQQTFQTECLLRIAFTQILPLLQVMTL